MPIVSDVKGPAYSMSVLLFLASVLLGGGTRAGFLSDVLLQFLSIPFLLTALWLWMDRLSAPGLASVRPTDRLAGLIGLAVAVLAALIALAQFVPLFGAAGTAAFWRQVVEHGGSLTGVPTGSSSLDPAMSRAALAAVLPALALFLLVGLLSLEERARLVGWIMWTGFGCLLLGLFQVLQGPASSLRFFRITNPEDAVGAFANRNHFASQMYVTIPFLVVWFALKCQGLFGNRTLTPQKLQWAGTGLALLLLFLTGLALARSRAGMLLTLVSFAPMVVMVPSLMTLLLGRPPRLPTLRLRAAISSGAVILLVLALGADRVIPRFEDTSVNDLRASITPTTARAVWDALPFGSGLATFVPVFRVYEEQGKLLQASVNRAHNDWVEFPLEAGLPGLLLMGLFLAWLVLRAAPFWINRPPLPPRDRLVGCAASLAIGLLLAHSVVDYPLRTGAMFGYFALFCALLVPPPAPARRRSAALA